MATRVDRFDPPLVMIQGIGWPNELDIYGAELAAGMGVKVVRQSDGYVYFTGLTYNPTADGTKVEATVSDPGVITAARIAARLEKLRGKESSLLSGFEDLTVVVDPDNDPNTANDVTTTDYHAVLIIGIPQ